MAHHLISSNATIKAIKPGDARQRLTDGAGLYLRLFVKGGSHGWRFDYSLNGRRNTLSLGTYPDTGLSLARKKAEEARRLVSAGTDPSDVRKETRNQLAVRRAAEQRVSDGLPPVNSFEAVAREWHTKNAPTWAESHSSKIIRRLEQDVFPWIGSKPVNAIRPMELLTLLKRVEDRGAIETTHRVQQNCGQVFRYAVATGRAGSDPSRDLRGEKGQAMTIDTEIRHVTKAGANLFLELGFSAAEAKKLHTASRKQINDTRLLKQQLMVELSNWITEHQLRQTDAAQILMVSRPRVSDVVNQKTAKFTIDTLVEMLSRVGKPVRLAVG